MQPPLLDHVADITVEVGTPVTVGQTPDGLRRIVPITGGLIRGERLNGSILPGGADFQLVRPDGLTRIDARYVVQLLGGELIYIVDTGLRFAPPDIMARLGRGEAVDPALVYFRTTIRFEASAEALRFLTERLFIATGARRPGGVELAVFELR